MNPAENPWKTFFDQHAPEYMQEVFTRNTAEEVKFIHRRLKSGGKLILNAPNGLVKIRVATEEDVESGRFDPMTLTETFDVKISTPQGTQKIELH